MKRIGIIVIGTLMAAGAMAQESFEEFRARQAQEFASFRKNTLEDYQAFRDKVNADYAAMLEGVWEAFEGKPAVPKPLELRPVPPVVLPKDDEPTPIADNPKPFDVVVPVVAPKPQPQPVVPFEEPKPEPKPTPVVPKEEPKPEPAPLPVAKGLAFKFFNTELEVRLDEQHRFSLSSTDGRSISKAWSRMASSDFNNVVIDCLKIRREHGLCDWAYLTMLDDMAQAFFGSPSNEATLLMAYLYCASGYKMRLATTQAGTLKMLYASHHAIYSKRYFTIDDVNFYCYGDELGTLNISEAKYPKEQPLSLLITSEQMLSAKASDYRSLQSTRYKDMTATVRVNENLIKFFDSYPSSEIDGNFLTRWAMYANTPLSEEAKNSLYPALTSSIEGKSEYDAVNRLLNFVQTAFVYEYDDKVWGHDRAFFADETLFYPYCDCEDRSILFSRLVRDLMGLDVILIYYPGHLATAIHFNEQATGDYISLQGRKFVVCDPTYVNAGIGRTMPHMDNSSAKVILLE